ncbi:MAG: hypothetical protein EOO29_54225, partial [Comamonadaceae bacterium]
MTTNQSNTTALPGMPGRRTLLGLAVATALTACGGGGQALVNGGVTTTGDFTISTHELASRAKAARTPRTAGVTVAPGSKLATQFGPAGPDLNRVRYTRYGLAANAGKPVDAVLVAMPGTLAASHSYLILAENLVRRMWTDHQAVVEVWGVDRRSVALQDMEGLQTAERERDAALGLNFLYGGELGLPLPAKLSRRAVFHESREIPFLADWTPQVHSLDLDAVVTQAHTVARNGNV